MNPNCRKNYVIRISWGPSLVLKVKIFQGSVFATIPDIGMQRKSSCLLIFIFVFFVSTIWPDVSSAIDVGLTLLVTQSPLAFLIFYFSVDCSFLFYFASI